MAQDVKQLRVKIFDELSQIAWKKESIKLSLEKKEEILKKTAIIN